MENGYRGMQVRVCEVGQRGEEAGLASEALRVGGGLCWRFSLLVLASVLGEICEEEKAEEEEEKEKKKATRFTKEPKRLPYLPVTQTQPPSKLSDLPQHPNLAPSPPCTASPAPAARPSSPPSRDRSCCSSSGFAPCVGRW